MISCYICHEPHHIAKDCPFRGDGRDDKHDGCYICGEMDHQKYRHGDFSHKQPKCPICDTYGHTASMHHYQKQSRFYNNNKSHRNAYKRWKKGSRSKIGKMARINEEGSGEGNEEREFRQAFEEMGWRYEEQTEETYNNALNEHLFGTNGHFTTENDHRDAVDASEQPVSRYHPAVIASFNLYHNRKQASVDEAITSASNEVDASHNTYFAHSAGGNQIKLENHSVPKFEGTEYGRKEFAAYMYKHCKEEETQSLYDGQFRRNNHCNGINNDLDRRTYDENGLPHIGGSPFIADERFHEACSRGEAGLMELLNDEAVSGVNFPSNVPWLKGMIERTLAKFPPHCFSGTGVRHPTSGWLWYLLNKEEVEAAEGEKEIPALKKRELDERQKAAFEVASKYITGSVICHEPEVEGGFPTYTVDPKYLWTKDSKFEQFVHQDFGPVPFLEGLGKTW